MTDDVKCLIRQMPLTTLDMNGTYQTELGFFLAASTGGDTGTGRFQVFRDLVAR